MPGFPAGMDVGQEDIPDILRELEALKEWMARTSDAQERGHAIGRLANLAKALKALRRERDCDLWIG